MFELEAAHDLSYDEVPTYKVDAAKLSVDRATDSMTKAINAFKLTKRKVMARRRQQDEDFKSTPAYKIQEKMRQSEAKARARGEEPLAASKDDREKFFKRMPASQERVLRIAKSRGIEFNTSPLIPGNSGTYTHEKPFRTGAPMKELQQAGEKEPDDDRPTIAPTSMIAAGSRRVSVSSKGSRGGR